MFLRIHQSKQTKKLIAIVEQAIKKSDINGEQTKNSLHNDDV
uniref:Uncharacterized protein n=1 Tax=Meloidogyne enterolobii TaxID=390850 RepID=A0A6V7X5W0_MELEN|nr:unnamed protein product [Meloidogyne enterolobii]